LDKRTKIEIKADSGNNPLFAVQVNADEKVKRAQGSFYSYNGNLRLGNKKVLDAKGMNYLAVSVHVRRKINEEMYKC